MSGEKFHSECLNFWDNIYRNQDKNHQSQQEKLDHLLTQFKYFKKEIKKEIEEMHPISVFQNCHDHILSIMRSDSVLAHELYSKQEALFSVAR